MDDDLVTVVEHAGAVATEDHGQTIRSQAHASQRPEVVVVQRAGPEGDADPPLSGLGLGLVVDDQAGQRVVLGLGDTRDCEHSEFLS
jgi:hypothetical protein